MNDLELLCEVPSGGFIVGVCVYEDRLIVATNRGVYWMRNLEDDFLRTLERIEVK